MENGRAAEPSLADGEGELRRRLGEVAGGPRRASRIGFGTLLLILLMLPRFCAHMPPPKPGTPFSLRGRLPKAEAAGHGLSSSDEATASESGVALRIGCSSHVLASILIGQQ